METGELTLALYTNMGNRNSSATPPNRMSNLPWQNGHYKCSNITTYDDMVLIKGNTVHMPGFAPPKMTAGVFGKAADEVVAVTGKTEYNVELVIIFLGIDMKMYGVVSEDGKKMTFKNMTGVGSTVGIRVVPGDTSQQVVEKILDQV